MMLEQITDVPVAQPMMLEQITDVPGDQGKLAKTHLIVLFSHGTTTDIAGCLFPVRTHCARTQCATVVNRS